jgi:uncharacterized membrane protein
MTELAAWLFDDERGARRIEPFLADLATRAALTLRDGRVLVWSLSEARPRARRIYSVPLTHALDDIGWGLLLAHVLYGSDAPWSQPLSDLGVERQILEPLRRGLAPGDSALVVLGDESSVTALVQALAPRTPCVRHSLLDGPSRSRP